MGNTNGCLTIIILIITSSLSYLSPSILDEDIEPYPFILVDGVVNYSFSETFNCNFIIGGRVDFLVENIDHENIVVKLQPLGTYDDRPAADAYIGSDGSYGLLLVGNYNYLVWVHDRSSDTPLSAQIIVDSLDCANERTRADLNFQQILPLSQT